jgi:hypothetical protein
MLSQHCTALRNNLARLPHPPWAHVMKRIAPTRVDVKLGHVNQFGNQYRVCNSNRARSGRAGQVA